MKTSLPLGTRVRFTTCEERYPCFIVPEGSTGTVTDVSEHCMWIKIDQDIPGLSDSPEWHGEMSWSSDDEKLLPCPFEAIP